MDEAEAVRQFRQGVHAGAIMIVVTIVLVAVMGALAPVTVVVADHRSTRRSAGPGASSTCCGSRRSPWPAA